MRFFVLGIIKSKNCSYDTLVELLSVIRFTKNEHYLSVKSYFKVPDCKLSLKKQYIPWSSIPFFVYSLSFGLLL